MNNCAKSNWANCVEFSSVALLLRPFTVYAKGLKGKPCCSMLSIMWV